LTEENNSWYYNKRRQKHNKLFRKNIKKTFLKKLLDSYLVQW